MTTNVRKGEDVRILMRLSLLEKDTNLKDLDLSLTLTNPYRQKMPLPIYLSGDILSSEFLGKDQYYLGSYHVTLWMNKRGVRQKIKDFPNAFTLVSRSTEVPEEGTPGFATVDLGEVKFGSNDIFDILFAIKEIEKLQDDDEILVRHLHGFVKIKAKVIKAYCTGGAEIGEQSLQEYLKSHLVKVNGKPLIDGEDITIEGGEGGIVDWQNVQNKPEIPTYLNQLQTDAFHQTVSQEQIDKWNSGTGGGTVSPQDILDTICDSALVVPAISTASWIIKTATGSVVSAEQAGAKRSGNNIEVEHGFVLKFEGKWKWNAATGRKNPTATSGAWGAALPQSGVESQPFIKDSITSNADIQQSISAPKAGVTVQGNKLVSSDGGTDSASCAVAARFSHRYYHGLVTTSSPQAADITQMAHTDLSNSKARKVEHITNDISHYFCYAYPKALGALSSAIYNSSVQIFTDFTRTEVNIENKAGVSIPYYVYTFNNLDAFGDSIVEFS